MNGISGTRCQHEWLQDGNNIKCSKCSAIQLHRIKIDDEMSYGIKSNGVKYSIRKDRNKYFYPDEWTKFYSSFNDEHKLLLNFLICTGARADEALHFKKSNLVDPARNIIKLVVTKKKARKPGEEGGKPRVFQIDSSLYKSLKQLQYDYVFLKINEGDMDDKQIKRKSKLRIVSFRELVKRHLKEVGLDPLQYGLHNIRKTHGMWLKALGVPMEEICLRLGHDPATYLKHYGSPSVFDGRDKEKMIKIIGRILGL